MAQRLLILSLLVGVSLAVPSNKFWPFGAGAGDTALPRNDDDYSGAISVNTLFFGVRRSNLYVCNNGIISFNGGVSTYTPVPFPVASQPVMAAFWGDVDTRPSNGGYVWYSRRGASPDADVIVNQNFPGIAFVSTYHFVATWQSVGYYNLKVDKLNTFQIVIVGNNDATFVLYNYLDNGIKWTTGDVSGGISAQVGFDAGDQTNFYTHPVSRTAGVVDIWKGSNIGVQGQYLYLVSSATITPAAPLLVNAPADATYQCGAVPATLPTAAPSGACQDGTLVTFTQSDATSQGTCPGTYTYRRTWAVSDRCARTASSTQITSVVDTTAPVISLSSGSVTYECGTTTPTLPTGTVTDTCSSARISFEDAAVSSCSGQSFTRTFNAVDNCGNTARSVATITVTDTTKPVLTIPADIEVVCGSPITTDVTGIAEARDTCSVVTITSTDSGSTTCPSTVTRTFTATDRCGNSVSGVQYIKIKPVCGDSRVEGGEQCDPPGPCCTSQCMFAPSTTVCRSAADVCDVAETCAGNNGVCPTDTFKPRGTRCGELFGMGDVALENSCTGNEAQCHGPPPFPFLTQSMSWTDFNVISFNGFTCSGGDVEGRLAARTATLDAFTLGQELTTALNGWKPFSLFVSGDASWSSGSLYPDGQRNPTTAGQAAFAYVGGVYTAPAYLADRLLNNESNAAVLAGFTSAQSYYANIQTQFARLPTNAQASVIFGNGLQITCSENSEFYHVSVDAAMWNQIHWFNLVGCRFNARWVVDITGTGNVKITGQPFPAIVERVIYNVLGSGRTITGDTGVAAHILAPTNSYTQTTGVTYGIVIVGNVIESRQHNIPNFKSFNPVTVGSPVLRAVAIGDTTIWLPSLAQLSVGDRVCIQGDCRIIVSGAQITVDGQTYSTVTVNNGFASQHDANSIMSAQISNPDSANRTPIIGAGNATDNQNSLSSASLAVVSSVAAAAAILLL